MRVPHGQMMTAMTGMGIKSTSDSFQLSTNMVATEMMNMSALRKMKLKLVVSASRIRVASAANRLFRSPVLLVSKNSTGLLTTLA